VRAGWRSAPHLFSERDRALLEFAEKLTRDPGEMARADLAPLIAVGLDEGGIVEAVHVIGYFNHINRVAEALGVDAETWMGG
jgi:uncharacterized peroxidase-related enzyme